MERSPIDCLQTNRRSICFSPSKSYSFKHSSGNKWLVYCIGAKNCEKNYCENDSPANTLANSAEDDNHTSPNKATCNSLSSVDFIWGVVGHVIIFPRNFFGSRTTLVASSTNLGPFNTTRAQNNAVLAAERGAIHPTIARPTRTP